MTRGRGYRLAQFYKMRSHRTKDRDWNGAAVSKLVVPHPAGTRVVNLSRVHDPRFDQKLACDATQTTPRG
jgi:hypothetical protein